MFGERPALRSGLRWNRDRNDCQTDDHLAGYRDPAQFGPGPGTLRCVGCVGRLPPDCPAPPIESGARGVDVHGKASDEMYGKPFRPRMLRLLIQSRKPPRGGGRDRYSAAGSSAASSSTSASSPSSAASSSSALRPLRTVRMVKLTSWGSSTSPSTTTSST